eukprot:752123-Hanusia_phi.AAC.5
MARGSLHLTEGQVYLPPTVEIARGGVRKGWVCMSDEPAVDMRSHRHAVCEGRRPGSQVSMDSRDPEQAVQSFQEASEITMRWKPTAHAGFEMSSKQARMADVRSEEMAESQADAPERAVTNESDDRWPLAEASVAEPDKDVSKEEYDALSSRTQTASKRDRIENLTNEALQAYLHRAEDRICNKLQVSLHDAMHETAHQIFSHREASLQKLKQTVLLHSHRNLVRHNIMMLRNIHERIWDDVNSNIAQSVDKTCLKSRYSVL